MTGVLQELAKPELARHAAQKLARLEIDLARGRRGHAVGIVVDLGNGIPGIFGRVAVDRVVIENTEDLCHYCHSSFWADTAQAIASPARTRSMTTTGRHVAVGGSRLAADAFRLILRFLCQP